MKNVMRCVMEDQRRFRVPAHTVPGVMDAFWGVAKFAPFAREQTSAITRPT